MSLRVSVLVVSLLLSGCMTSGPNWTKDPPWVRDACDPSGEAMPSGNAPLSPPFDLPMSTVAQRVSSAMGDELDPGRENFHPSIGPDSESDVWVTEHGVLWPSYTQRNSFKMESERTWPPLGNESGRQTLEAFLRDLGIPASVERSIVYDVQHAEGSGVRSAQYRVLQAFQGRTLGVPVMEGWVAERSAGPGGSDSRFVSGFELRRIHDLSGADVSITVQNATERAVAFFECARNHDGVGQPDPGFAVAFNSLAFDVMVLRDSEACGTTGEGVLVDARTGAILGFSGTGMSVHC